MFYFWLIVVHFQTLFTSKDEAAMTQEKEKQATKTLESAVDLDDINTSGDGVSSPKRNKYKRRSDTLNFEKSVEESSKRSSSNWFNDSRV